MSGMLSVVVTYYNGGQFIKPCLQSIDRQTYDNVEVVIVDDSSEPNHIDTLKSAASELSYPTKIIYHEENQGISEARNTGVEAASGQYIAIHDQDDVSLPERFEQQIAVMEANPSVGTTMTNVHHIGPDGEDRGIRQFKLDLDEMTTMEFVRYMFERWKVRGPALPLTTEVSRSSVFEKVGVYNPNYYGSLDQEFLFRVASEYDVRIIDEPLVKKRYHNKNATRKDIKLLQDERKMTEDVVKLFPELRSGASKRDAFLYLVEARKQYQQGEYVAALQRFLVAIEIDLEFTLNRIARYPSKFFN